MPAKEYLGDAGFLLTARCGSARWPRACPVPGRGAPSLGADLERISRKVEAQVHGDTSESQRGIWWEMLQAFKGSLYFLLSAPVVLLLSLIPLVGPVAGSLWGAHALAFQQTDVPLARRGRDFRARRAWHRRYRAESIGFGLAGLITLIVPLANLLIGPALAVGGTLLVIEFEEGLPAAPDPAPAPLRSCASTRASRSSTATRSCSSAWGTFTRRSRTMP